MPITSTELRDVHLPVERNGFSQTAVNHLVDRAADTVDGLERRVAELLETIAMVRAESSVVELAVAPAAPAEAVLGEWLATLNPTDIDRHVDHAVAEAIVEATLAARRIRQEAVDRVTALSEFIAGEAVRLIGITDAARGTVTGMNRLPADLADWQGAFAGQLRGLLDQMQLPWNTRVAQLAALLARMHDGHLPTLGGSTPTGGYQSPPDPGAGRALPI